MTGGIVDFEFSRPTHVCVARYWYRKSRDRLHCGLVKTLKDIRGIWF